MTALRHRLGHRLQAVAGGPARTKVVVLLGCALGLDTADAGSVGAVAAKLEHALSLNNTELGILAAVPAICSAIATVPMGVLADRTSRVRLLWLTMLAFAIAEGASGLAQSYGTLLVIRAALGLAAAAAMPAVASLVGDLFPSDERGRIWGLILGGELAGAAFGYVIAGEAASFGPGSWRFAFFVLALPSLAGVLAIRRWLPEPGRGGQSCLEPGALEIIPAGHGGGRHARRSTQPRQSKAQSTVADQRVAPEPARVLHQDPERMSLLRTLHYILRIPTNAILIVASSLGYFYFTGLTTFGLVFFEGRFHLAHGAATLLLALLGLGGLIGVFVSGRLADRWLAKGHVNSRIVVGGASYVLAALFFLPGLISASMLVSLPLFVLAAIGLGARNPPLDAARLDVMHHRLWGRAEAARTLLRRSLTASAPLVFGLIADQFAPAGAHGSGGGTHGMGATANAQGLRIAFLLLLVTLALGGILTLLARRTYPRDVATALASEDATAGAAREQSSTRPRPARGAAAASLRDRRRATRAAGRR